MFLLLEIQSCDQVLPKMTAARKLQSLCGSREILLIILKFSYLFSCPLAALTSGLEALWTAVLLILSY